MPKPPDPPKGCQDLIEGSGRTNDDPSEVGGSLLKATRLRSGSRAADRQIGFKPTLPDGRYRWGQIHGPEISAVRQASIDLPGHVALEAAHDLPLRTPLFAPALHLGLGFGIA